MATTAPAGSGAPAAPAASPSPSPAPPAQPGGASQSQGGEQTFDLAGAIGEALSIGQAAPSGAQAPPQQGASQQQTPPPAGDALDDLLRTLPEGHPAKVQAQALKTAEGRWRAEQARAAQRQQEGPSREQQIAEAALIRAARSDPGSIHELAAMAGVDPQVLAEAAGISSGAVPQPRRGLDPDLVQPQLAGRIYQLFNERAALDHAESWSKPIMEARTKANDFRTRAFELSAEARLAESPGQREELTRRAQEYAAQASELELRSLTEHSRAMFGLANAITQPLREQVAELIGLVQRVQAAEAEEIQRTQASSAMLNEAATALGDDGQALFGPAGYGIFEIDAAGNPTRISDTGRKILDAIPGVCQMYGIPIPQNVPQLEAAIVLLSNFAPSEGAPGQPAAPGEAGGVPAQPASWAPGGFGPSPSLSGGGQTAPRY